MARWKTGEADVEQLLAARELQVVRGQAADGVPGLVRARQTTGGGHLAVERAVRAQFGAPFAPYGGLRRRRNEVEYPAHPDETDDTTEAVEALDTAETLIDAAERLLPHLGHFSP